MADNVHPIASVTVDWPHADGYVSLQNSDHDWTWRTIVKDGAVLNNVAYDRVEYIDALRCLKPTGYTGTHGMDEVPWQKSQITQPGVAPFVGWRYTIPAVVSPRRKFLDYFNSSPNAEGSAVCAAPMHPYFGLIIKRYAPNANRDWPYAPPINTDVGWAIKCTPFQTPGNPNTDLKNFCFFFPTKSQSYNQIYANMSNWNQDPMSEGTCVSTWHWEEMKEIATEPGVEAYWFEMVDGWWLIRKYGAKDPWVWRPPVANPADAFGRGNIELVVWGQCAMFWAGPIHYQDGAKATYVDGRLYDDGLHAANRVYTKRLWSWADRVPLQNVTITEQPDPLDGGKYVLEAKFVITSGGDDTSPALWVGVERAPAAHAAGVSAPESLTGHGVRRLQYTINYKGRGQTLQVNVEDDSGAIAWRGNEKITASVGWSQDGTNPDVTTQKFAGFIAAAGGVQRERDWEMYGMATGIRLNAGDPVETRLTKKFWMERSSPCDRELAGFVYEVLWDCGQHDAALADITALIGSTPTIPRTEIGGAPAFEFTQDTCVIDALDAITQAVGWDWGWDCQTGKWFLRLEPVTALTPTVTLTDASMIGDLEHSQGNETFRNCIAVFSDQGAACWKRTESINDTNAADFIGDDWWYVLICTETGDNTALIQRTWQEILRQASVIKWKQRGNIAMGPGTVIKFQVTRANIVTDTIYRIAEEVGEEEQGGVWEQTFTAEKWVPLV